MNNHRRGQISNKRDYVRQCLYRENIEVIASDLSLWQEYYWKHQTHLDTN